jgi:pyridoxine 5-phosphate synthase
VAELSALLESWPGREFNIEGNPFHNLLEFIEQHRPDQATLVPDGEGQFTSDHGWNLLQDKQRLQPVIAQIKKMGVRVSLFMDPDPGQMQLARQIGADRIELYTEPYAQAHGTARQAEILANYIETARMAQQHGLAVNAGHDLNLSNLPAFLKAVPDVKEVSIGHALISDALEIGYENTVRAYLACCQAS